MRAHLKIGLWSWILFLALAVSSWSIVRRSAAFHEFPWGCDPFGYIHGASEWRRAIPRGEWPATRVESEQARSFIHALKELNRPLEAWRDGIGPHSTHYYPASDQVAIQYPPGTGLVLSLFPEGRAIFAIHLLAIASFLATFCVLSFRLVRRGEWIPQGLLALATLLALDIFRRLGDISLSAQVSLLLISLGSVAAVLWRHERNPKLACVWAAASGLISGALVSTRLVSALIIPGWIGSLRSKPLVFWGGAFALFGAMPVLVQQKLTTGGWLISAYPEHDRKWTALGDLPQHLSFYLGAGDGAIYGWVLACIGVGALADYFSRGRSRDQAWTLMAGLTSFGLSVFYFVLHDVMTRYYLLPATIAASWTWAVGSAMSGEGVRPLKSSKTVRVWSGIGLLPGIVALAWVLSTRGLESKRYFYPEPPFEAGVTRPVIAEELKDPTAWIYSDLLSGTFWHFEKRVAFKLPALGSEERLILYRLANERGGRQFWLDDSETSRLDDFRRELGAIGGSLEERGRVGKVPYFEIRWKTAP